MTPAIEVRVLNRLPLFHKFVITPNSPLNLLGRDLMHNLVLRLYFSDSSVNFFLLSDVPYATVDVMPYFMSNDEPQRFKYNIRGNRCGHSLKMNQASLAYPLTRRN